MRDLGPGWIVLAVATVGLSVNSESRQSIFQYPAAIALLAVAADRREVSDRAVWCIAVVALALSKFWLPINIDPANMVNTDDPMMAWYYRRFFLNHGPWMSNEAYVINALAAGIAGLAVWWAMRERSTTSATFANPQGGTTAASSR